MTPFTLLYDSNILFLNVPFPFLLEVLLWVWGFFLLCNCHKVLAFIDFLSHYFLSSVSLSFSNNLLLPAVTKAP